MAVNAAIDLFRSTYQEAPTWVGLAPGRVNLIGEHTDYNDGFVFPAAIDKGLAIAAGPGGAVTETVSRELGPGLPFDVNDLNEAERDAMRRRADNESWSKYGAGVAWAFHEAGHSTSNLRVAIASDIPIGSGVSSSAALQVAFGLVWRRAGDLDLSQADLAILGQRGSNAFVGVQSGIMDEMACACGRLGQAMFLDTRTREIRYAPIPTGISVVLLDTGTSRKNADSVYNVRVQECQDAAQALGLTKLRDASLDQLEAVRSRLEENVYRRARHVINENARCLKFAAALEMSDLPALGKLMHASHESLRTDYEVSSAELDEMAAAAWAAPGAIGARMTGAGMGGACVALAETVHLADFVQATIRTYDSRTGLRGTATDCEIAQGAHLFGSGD